MGASEYADRFVFLRGGLVVPVQAYLLLLDLEARSFSLALDGSVLVVTPPAKLTRDDCAAIRHWKRHLLSLMEYSRRPSLDAHLFTDQTSDTAVERRPA